MNRISHRVENLGLKYHGERKIREHTECDEYLGSFDTVLNGWKTQCDRGRLVYPAEIMP